MTWASETAELLTRNGESPDHVRMGYLCHRAATEKGWTLEEENAHLTELLRCVKNITEPDALDSVQAEWMRQNMADIAATIADLAPGPDHATFRYQLRRHALQVLTWAISKRLTLGVGRPMEEAAVQKVQEQLRTILKSESK